jgi:hypothetical protein
MQKAHYLLKNEPKINQNNHLKRTIMKKHSLLAILVVGTCIFNHVNAQQWGMYTLCAPINSTQTYLIDTNGTTYKTWTHTSTQKTGFSVYLLDGDTLLRAVSHTGNSLNGGGMTGEVQKVTWNGTIVWDYAYSTSSYCLHHDICPMPGGNVLMTCYEVKSATEVTNAGCSQNIILWSEKLIEVHPTGYSTGTIVWEWHLWDHLCQSYNASKPNYYADVSQHPELLNINYQLPPSGDWIHMNGLDYNEALDQITFSSRTQNEIYVIDHSTTTAEASSHAGGNSGKGGDLLYRWGNPAAYGVTGTTVFNVVHDAHWISSDNPNYPNYLCGFNNGGGASGKSCIDIFNPPYNGYTYSYSLGTPMPPTTYAYRHTSTYTSNSNGASQELPNGNILVCISTSNYLYELNPAGTSIWNKTISGGQPANAVRYELCYVRGLVATAGASSTSVTAGTPVTLNSSATSVTETSPTYSYSWSSSPAGFTSSSQNPSATPTTTTTYTVTITNTGLGCTSSASVTINVTVGVDDYSDGNELTVYPNPTTGIVNINENFISNDYQVYLCNSFGEAVMMENNAKTIDLSDFPAGIYYLKIRGEKVDLIKKIILIK